ncbi:MAG: hypothetical protein ACKV2V_19290 [Blastocatellia bacterium]
MALNVSQKRARPVAPLLVPGQRLRIFVFHGFDNKSGGGRESPFTHRRNAVAPLLAWLRLVTLPDVSSENKARILACFLQAGKRIQLSGKETTTMAHIGKTP